MSQVPREPELNEIESGLRALVPSPSRLDRDRLMFEAGVLLHKRTARRRWLWPAIAAGLGAIAAGESVLLVARPAPRVVERLVVVREPGPTEPAVAAPNRSDAAPHVPGPDPDGSRSVARDRARDDAIESPDSLLAGRWETVGDFHFRRGGRSGFDGLPVYRRPDYTSRRPGDGPGSLPATVGELRRLNVQ